MRKVLHVHELHGRLQRANSISSQSYRFQGCMQDWALEGFPELSVQNLICLVDRADLLRAFVGCRVSHWGHLGLLILLDRTKPCGST